MPLRGAHYQGCIYGAQHAMGALAITCTVSPCAHRRVGSESDIPLIQRGEAVWVCEAGRQHSIDNVAIVPGGRASYNPRQMDTLLDPLAD